MSPSAGSVLLKLDGLTKRFGAVTALDDVSLSIDAGEVHCLLGENGAGKSTLCNVVFGVHAPDAGQMHLEGRPFRPTGPADSLSAGVAMVHQHFSLVPTMTVVENLMLGRLDGVLKRRDFAARVRELGATYGLEVDPDRRVAELSVGERQRVEIIKCLIRDPRLLVLDEPTAVLPPEEVAALLAMCRRVAAAGRGVILVTHKLAEIARVADRTTVLRAGKVVESVTMKVADMRALVRAMVGRELVSIDRMVAVSLGMEAAGHAGPPPRPARPAPANVRTRRDDALMVDGVSYRDHGGALRLDRVTLIVKPGEIVGIAGVEGNGQSELAAIIAGLVCPTGGRIFVGGRELTRRSPGEVTAAGAGIIPEDRHAIGCIEEMTVAENLFLGALGRFTRFGLLRRRAMGEAAAALMHEFDVRGSGPGAPMKSLSGGNQQRAVLARELSLDPLVFLLAAQPTRGLDVGAVDAVYGRIFAARENGAGVLLISSELDELLAASDRIIVLYRGRIVGELPAEAGNREAIGSLMSGHAA
ncbi:MAG: ABC transporter ATP-binding protein [Candidatus Rokubacteria bacterium]|nr:ABC transporter ATP-binding protein [Candidatus Rokubacteria bacterium]